MVSAPINLYTAKTANEVAKVRVLLGPADGSDDEFTESFDLIPLEVSITAGATPDYAVFEYKTDRLAEILDATETVTGNRDEISFNRQVWVRVEDRRDPENNRRTLFWGELLTETLHIDPVSQRITIAARVAPYHFGKLLEGEYHWDALADAEQLIAVDPVFNPLIDGVIEGNRLYADGDPSLNDFFESMWVDPDALRSSEARQALGESVEASGAEATGELWELNDAVEVISLRLLYTDDVSEFIDGPDTENVADSIWEDQPDIKNLKLPRGRHLPDLLDMLLIPHGYAWYLDHSGFDPDAILGLKKPQIICFRRGEGINRSVKLQATGEELDLAKTNAAQIDLSTDVGNLANKMYGWGSFEQKELTIELFRGWPESDDSISVEELRKSEPTSEYNETQKHTAWRLWVGNEGGDYTGTRTATEPITDYLDLSTVFGAAVPTRRPIEDCLTLDSQGKRRVTYLEWSSDAGSTFSEIPLEWGWVPLPDQIGVLFTGDTPPEEMVDAGDDCRVRITCTITGDERLNSTSSPILDESPSLREVPLYLDLSDRFHKRSVQTTGPLASVLAGDANGADEVDDSTNLQHYLADMLEAELSAEMRTAFRLHGIHADYEISDLVISVDGRDFFLNRNKYNPDDKGEKKYPQIYGIRWLFQEQVTELITEAIG